MWCARTNVQRLSAALVVGMSVAGPRLAAQEARPAGSPRLSERACPSPASDDVPAIVPTLCGTVTVAQDRRATRRRGLAPVVLPVAIYRAEGANGTPVLFLSGGPGQSSIELVEQALLRTPVGRVLAREHPIIAFDRRGISPATPGASPDLGRVNFAPVGRRAAALAALADSLSQRGKELRARGVDPSAFTTAAAVEDIADVLGALHVRRVILFGASYGTHEALQFMRRHGAMVEAAVLDGVAPPTATQLLDSAYMANAGRAIASRIIDECRLDPDCGAGYPELARAVSRLTDSSATRLRRTAQFRIANGDRVSESWHTIEVAGPSVLSVLGVASSLEEVRASLPRIVEEFASADTLRHPRASSVLLAAALDPSLQTSARQEIGLLRFIVFCGDRPQGEPLARSRVLCDALDVPFGGPEAIAPVTSDVPALLISSGYDAQTPAEVADEAAKTLRKARRAHFPTAGHIAFTRPIAQSCVALIVDAFIRYPAQEPPVDCAGRLIPAFLPHAVSATSSATARER